MVNLVVTGGTGYVGARLVKQARALGHEVIIAGRRAIDTEPHWMQFDLCSNDMIVLPAQTDMVFHLAVDSSSLTQENDELRAAKLLIAATHKVAAKFIFVSSQTARENAPTKYGRTKWYIEQEVLAAGGVVVRPGQVYGGCELGLFGTLSRFVRRLPALPAFLPSPKIQPIHIDDLIVALLRITDSNIQQKIFYLGSSTPISFTTFLLTIAAVRVRRLRIPIPIPVLLIGILSKLVGKRLSGRFGFNQLYSLFDLPLMDTNNSLHELGLSLRSLESGMHLSGNNNRRKLCREGYALLFYILNDKPSSTIVRRYIRAIEQLKLGKPMNLPLWALNCPQMLALLDDHAFVHSNKGTELAWRLHAATVLAEASIQGSQRFLKWNMHPGLMRHSIGLLQLISSEIFWRLLRLFCLPFLSFFKSAWDVK